MCGTAQYEQGRAGRRRLVQPPRMRPGTHRSGPPGGFLRGKETAARA
jgi:hypothetical protein